MVFQKLACEVTTERIFGYLFYPAIVLVGIAVWNGNTTAVEIKTFILEVFFLVMLFIKAFCLFFSGRLRLKWDRSVIFAGLYGISIVLAFFSTKRLSMNFFSVMPQFMGVLTFLFVVQVFEKDDFFPLIRVCFYTIGICSIYGNLQELGFDPLHWEKTDPGAGSFFSNPNHFAMVLITIIPIGCFLMMASEKRMEKTGCLLLLVSMGSALAFTGSRGAILCFAASFLVMIFMSVFSFKKIRKRVLTRQILLVFGISIVLVFLVLPEQAKTRFLELSNLDEPVYQTRLKYYKAAFHVIKENPIWGVGPGNFAHVYPKSLVYPGNPNRVLQHIHNDFLEIQAEYGIFSLILYVGFLGFLTKDTVSALFVHESFNNKGFFLFFLGALWAWILYSGITVAPRFTGPAFFFWLVCGISRVIRRDSPKEPELHQKTICFRSVPFRLSLPAGILVLFVLFSQIVLANYTADIYERKGFQRIVAGKTDEAVSILKKAASLRPKSVEAYYRMGYAHYAMHRYEKALSDYLKVHEMVPGYINVEYNLATIYYKLKDWNRAVSLAEASIRRYPGYIPAVVLLAWANAGAGNETEALRWCEMALHAYKNDQNLDAYQNLLILKRKLKN